MDYNAFAGLDNPAGSGIFLPPEAFSLLTVTSVTAT